jgi:hypothetical protein
LHLRSSCTCFLLFLLLFLLLLVPLLTPIVSFIVLGQTWFQHSSAIPRLRLDRPVPPLQWGADRCEWQISPPVEGRFPQRSHGDRSPKKDIKWPQSPQVWWFLFPL